MTAIIPQPLANQQQPHWQDSLRDLITSPLDLLSYLALSPHDIPWQWDDTFALRVTKSYAARMKKGDPFDPLLKQVLSSPQESQLSDGFSYDPLKESDYNPIPGVLHKFPSRVLLTFTSSCAIHCRYCFRRHFPYSQNNPGRKGWQAALAYIQQHPEIIEVILSGGDPLMAQDEVIQLFLKELTQISHVKLLRIHTRVPVVIPERIGSKIAQILGKTRLLTSVVYHINHANEIIPDMTEGVLHLKKHNITVLNQSVLLAGVNDEADSLKTLSLALFATGILPYYIHLLDTVHGSHHFSVSIKKAKELQNTLRAQLPGYLIPKFVQEVPKESSKIPLDLLPS